MTISDLPSDLIEEILFRVPAPILERSRFTCKRWNALVKDPVFIRKHFDKAPSQSMVIVHTHLRFWGSNPHGIGKKFIPLRKFRCNLRVMDPRRNLEVYMSKVFYCDGLLLCITSEDKRLVVWNPCTGQTMWLKFIKPSKSNLDMYAFGYAKNQLCHDYKILRRFNIGARKRIEIYEFCSNSWRLLDDDFPPNCIIQSSGVSLKGDTYWIVSSHDKRVLLCFDFSMVRFRSMSFPFQKRHMSLANFRGEQLSLLQWNLDAKEVEMWVSARIETTNLSWRKFLKVRFSDVPYVLDHRGSSLFINYDEKAVVWYQNYSFCTGNLVQLIGEEEDNFREISLGQSTDFISWGNTYKFVPSLVRIQDGIITARGKRKRG